MPRRCRWKRASTPRRSITRARARPPTTRKRRRRLSRSASPCFRAMRWPAYLRLRQICLVAPHLEPVISDISAIMGLNVCYRDGNVAKYGLENALLPVDTILLEVVAPFQPGTAAGRFLDKTGGRGGYMAIFCCDDPDARGKHANGDGRAHRQRDHARALSRRATASARLPRGVHRVQPHRRQRRYSGRLSAGGAGLAEVDPEGCDAGADWSRDAEPGSARRWPSTGGRYRVLPSARVRAASRN